MNDAQRCRKNKWKVGDVLQDRDGRRLRLTAIGEKCVLAVEIFWGGEQDVEREWDLSLTRWRRIGRWNKRTRKVEGT
jgi:hypothetical protein